MSLKSEAIRYWRMGQYDTADIARILGASEAEVYSALAHREELAPRKEPAPIDTRSYRPKQRQTRGMAYKTYYPNRFVREDVRA